MTNRAATLNYSSGHEDKQAVAAAATGIDNPASKGTQDEENIEIDPQQSSVVEWKYIRSLALKTKQFELSIDKY